MRVLVAEDENKTRAMLVEMLQDLGCEVTEVSKGLEALKRVSDERPEVVLLDGLLPEMHGFEIARHIRALDPAYRPRIVIITAVYKAPRYRTEATKQYGVDEYVVKPVTRKAVEAAVFGTAAKN